MITSSELRQKFLDFFKEKNHAILPSAPLVPENDPTVLFNTAGMQPLVPYLMGKEHPKGTRLADAQKCVRTVDIDEVGDDSHCTFFEMLGNWSLGDYFKQESISWSWEFLTDSKWLGLDPNLLAVTVFEGDDQVGRDETSADIWKSLGMPENRISYLGAEDNWWAAVSIGPCGPDTEIFYWVGKGKPPVDSNVKNDEDNWMEIWNNVFMEFERKEDKTLVSLPKKNVDTGMGLERALAILNRKTSVYDTDLFEKPLSFLQEKMGNNFSKESARIMVDHTRTAVHMIADGVVPKNVDQGYILRRLLRKAIREAYVMGCEDPILTDIAEFFIEIYAGVYESVNIRKKEIIFEIQTEEMRFQKTLKKWLKQFEKILKGHEIAFERTGKKVTQISGDKAFTLYDTYGFPLEMTVDLAKEKNLTVDTNGFEKRFKNHQELARTASAGKFKGGLADGGEQTTRLHTATHLMLAGLRKYLGDHVHQAGSNITPERLRFDFTHPEKVQRDVLDQVENFVNKIIEKKAIVENYSLSKEEAKANGIVGSFWEKYPDTVSIYKIHGIDGEIYSEELCGGPHVKTTEWMGKFRIKKEESSSSGVRRIKAILE